MQFISKFVSALLILSGFFTNLGAVNIVNYGNTIFSEAISPGNASLGGASSFIDPIPGGFLLNPANHFSHEPNILFSYRNIFSGMGVSRTINYSWSGQRYNYAVGLMQRVIPEISNTSDALAYWDSNGPHLDYAKISKFDDKTYGLFLSGAMMITSDISIGMTVKPMIHKIDQSSAWGAGIDAGVVYRKNTNLGLGLSIRNILPFIKKWNTGNLEVILPEISGDLSYRYKKAQLHTGVSTHFTGSSLSKNDNNYLIGIQYSIYQNIIAKAGSSRTVPLSLGFALNINKYHVDYVCLVDDGTENTPLSHGVSIWMELDNILAGMDRLDP